MKTVRLNKSQFFKTTTSCVALLLALASVGIADDAKPVVGKGPLKIFLLAGQSNMEGHATLPTVDFLGEDPDPARAALLKKFKPDGKTLVTRDDVWVVSNGAPFDKLQPGLGARKDAATLGGKIGPEYGFGYFMGEALEEQVLLIKVAEGGTSLHQSWRPPSAGPLPNVKPEEVGEMYRALVLNTHDTVRDLKKLFPAYDEKAGYEIAGLVWFQGYNDMFDETGRKEYGKNLVMLIKDLRKEFNAPNMKVAVGVMGVNGPLNEGTINPKQKDIREGQRFVNTVEEFKGNVKAFESAPLLHPKVVELTAGEWLHTRDFKKDPHTPEEKALLQRATSNMGFHYNGEGRFFILLGKQFADTMLDLMRSK